MENYYLCKHFIQNLKGNNSIFWTIIAGVFVFIFSQIILEFILKPLREYQNIKNEIFNKLKLYSNIITNPISEEDLIIDDNRDAYNIIDISMTQNKKEFLKKRNQIVFENYLNISKEIRKLSCNLEVKYRDNCVFMRKIFINEDIKDLNNAVGLLMRISNSLFDKSKDISNGNDINNIKKYLNLNK